MPARKKAAAVTLADDFTPDAFMIRTTDKNGLAYNDFEWPRTVGAIVTCPDWDPAPRCGGGLHGVLDGLGNWGLMSDAPDAIWWVVGVLRSEAVILDGEKAKAPRARVEFFGRQADAMTLISRHMQKAIWSQANAQEAAAATTGDGSAAATTGDGSAAATTGDGSAAATTGDGSAAATTGYGSAAATTGDGSAAATTGDGSAAATTGDGSAAATTGDGSAAATTGYGSAAATTGYGSAAATTWSRSAAATTGDGSAAATTGSRSAAATTGSRSAAATTGSRSAAATTGDGSAAATTGDGSAAATTGRNSIAAALGPNSTAKAGAGGAIMLAAYDDDWNLVAVFSSLVGQNGVDPDVSYRLLPTGSIERLAS